MIIMEATAAATAETKVRVVTTLPEHLVANIDGMASSKGISFDDALAAHLEKTIQFGAERPIYIDDAGRLEIARLLGARIKDQKSLLDMIRRLVSWNAGGHKVRLTPNQLESLHWRAKALNQTLEQFIPGFLANAIAAALKTR
jgi:hypothetical protein